MSSAATSPTLATGVEDDPQLAGQAVELGVVEVDPGERGEMRDLVAGDGGHGASV